jgi:glycosyltransferase involved in cell wall biosynthesis
MKLKKPRIVILIRDITAIGGAQLNALRLASQLVQAGFPLTLMGRGDYLSIKQHLARFNIASDIPISPIAPPSRNFIKNLSEYWPNIFFILPCFLKLWEYRKRFDILYAPLLMESGLLCAFASIFLGKPSVVKIGSAGPYGDVQRALRVATSAPRRKIFKRITKFVCLTKEIKDELLNELDIPYDKLIGIPNGVDIQMFRPVNPKQKRELRANMCVNSDEKIVLFVGRLELKKRVDILLNAWEKLQVARNVNARLLIVGDGSLRPELTKLRDKMESWKTVTFYGESEQIPLIMQAADIFVLPSISEGLANVFLESMASGLAIIATNTNGNAEILKNHENALLFQEEDIQELSDTILYLLEHDAVAKRLGKNARRVVEDRFSLSRVVKQYIVLYQLLAESRA